jgi:nucleoside-triphosphatase THEP1
MNDKNNYLLHTIQTGKEELLASTTSHFQSAIQYGEYYFDPKIFELGNQILMSSVQKNIIILDEFGPLEIRKTGFYSGFNFLVKHYKGILIIALRPGLQSYLRNILSGRQ